MRSVIVIFFAFIAQVHAEQDSTDNLVDMLGRKLMNKLVDQLLESPVLQDLDSTTNGKPAQAMGTMTRAAALPAMVPQVRFQGGVTIGCPVMPRTSSVARADVKLGSDSGGLVFVPDEVTIKAGESVKFVNNAGFPHNIIFDEDSVPEGVAADSLSREDYLNAPGEEYKVKFDKAGTYGYYCQPHQGAGMKGTIIVQ